MLLILHSSTTILTLFLLLLFLHSPSISATHLRRLHHHPFFPPSLPPTQPPSTSPPSQPQHHPFSTSPPSQPQHHPFSTSPPSQPQHHPFSTSPPSQPQHHPFSTSLPSPPSPPSPPTSPTPTTSTFSGDKPFFPTYPPSPPPPQPPSSTTTTTTSLPTFPANISSLALPSSSSSSSHSHSHLSSKLILILILLSLLTLSLLLSLSLLLHRRRHRHRHLNSKPLHHLPSPPPPPPKLTTTTTTSSEFLYIPNSHEFHSSSPIEPPSTSSEIYIKLCGAGDSPELRPLPPLPKSSYLSFEHNPIDQQQPKLDEEQFFSPKSDSQKVYFDDDNYGLNSSPTRTYSDSLASDSDISVEIQTLAARTSHFPAAGKMGPPAAPPPPPRQGVGPPPLVPPSGPVVFKTSGNLGERKSGERKEELGKTKLKALHWDKVRACSDRAMVWDHLKPGSFQLNEEMIETLFKANGPNIATKDGPRRSILPLLDEEYRVLDPKKSQNIAILLKALNVTEDEVCEALLEGNADALGTELLESLLKMAPTNEEERKLREYRDESPLKLGPAEKFLKAVLDHVPSAFKRVDAMLYIATFDSEVEYLRKSFETLEAACAELRNSRMFLKLLEAVLKTGNRMNVGTNRGDAQAFKLATLLKLIDVKGTDGKTTLLHFVVQEIIKSEGSRFSSTNVNPARPSERTNDQPSLQNDIELRKKGLEVVSGLGGELVNVKKAAAMDYNFLSVDVAKLARGIIRVNEVLQSNEDSTVVQTNTRFSDSMKGFLKKAEIEIVKIQSQESCALSRVKELTEYFDGNLGVEEAHPLRIFMVVRDFLGVLDQVCKEVGKVNERTIISSARPFAVSINPSPAPPFPEFSGTRGDSSSDDESLTGK